MRSLHICILTLACAGLGQAVAQTYLPSEKSAAGEKLIHRSVDADGHVIYSDHLVEGAKVNKSFDLRTFAPMPPARPVAASTPDSKVAAPDRSQAQIDVDNQKIVVQNRKIEAANELARKQNCETAKSEVALLKSGKRISSISSDGATVPLDDAARDVRRKIAQAAFDEHCPS